MRYSVARAYRSAGGDLKLASRFGLAANQLATRPAACSRLRVYATARARLGRRVDRWPVSGRDAGQFLIGDRPAPRPFGAPRIFLAQVPAHARAINEPLENRM